VVILSSVIRINWSMCGYMFQLYVDLISQLHYNSSAFESDITVTDSPEPFCVSSNVLLV
jgi:hypothetical protein